MKAILKNNSYITYILLFLCLQCYGLPYKATLWVKQTQSGGPIKKILNLHDIHLDPNARETQAVIDAIVGGCKKNNCTLLLEECNLNHEDPVYKSIYQALAKDKTTWFSMLSSKAIKDKVNVIQADHRGIFYNLYHNLFENLWKLDAMIGIEYSVANLTYLITTINTALRRQITENEEKSLLIYDITLNFENPFVKNALSLFTIKQLKEQYAKQIASVLSEAENLIIKNEVTQLLIPAKDDISLWIKKVESLQPHNKSIKHFKSIEDSLNVSDIVNNYIARSELFYDACEKLQRGIPTAYKDLKNLCPIEYVWDTIFNAGVLVEIEKAFQNKHSDCIVIVTGGRHATSLDKLLEKQSYTMIKNQEMGDPLNLKEGQIASDIILPAKDITSFF